MADAQGQRLAEMTQEIEGALPALAAAQAEVGRTIVGQKTMVSRLLMALVADGHILIEGSPGLAKTSTVKAVADVVSTGFARIQFTPDLLPADLIGTEVYRPQTGDFAVKKGPIFSNLLLADEINRAPAKVQSALLEAMQERQVTLGETTYKLPEPFLVLATQNPIEQEGTYALPEAQLDRFMFKLLVGYPSRDQEREIMRRAAVRQKPPITPALSARELGHLRQLADHVYIDSKLEDYIVDIVLATRDAENHPRLQDLAPLIAYGASPRATINLARASRVAALFAGRPYVTPQDVKAVAPDILRHRILLSYEAEAQNVLPDSIVAKILSTLDVP